MSARELITEHLDLWTGAVTKKASSGRGSNGKVELTGVKKLRELILELAVRGKLVDQNPADEPASVLLSRIKVKKEELVKLGKIKRPRSLPPITNEEAPSDLPPSWACARAGDFLHIEMGQSPASKFYNQAEDGLPFFQGKADFGDLYPTARYWCTHPTKYAEVDDILLSVRAPVGPTNISNISACIGRGLCALRPLAGVPPFMVLYMFRAIRSELESRATGTTFAAVSRKDIETLVLRVPPLPEQHRIAQKVDELMALCDRLEQQTSDQLEAHETLVDTLLSTLIQSENATELADNWARLAAHFDTLFTTEQSIDKLRQTVLQLGMMGALTESHHDLMPPPISLETLRAEKEEIARKTRIKAPKAPAESSADESPYRLPNSWLWARVGDVIALKHGYAFKSSYFSESEGPLVLTTPGNFHEKGGFRDRGVKTKYYEGPVDEEFVLKAHDLIIPMTEQAPGLLGSAAFIPEDGKVYLHNQRLGKLLFNKAHFDPRFVYWFFNSKLLRNELARTCSGTTVRHTSPSRVAAAFIPVPSIRTQQEIVKKIDELMALCDQLLKRLNQASETRRQLAEAVVEQTIS